MQAFFVYLLKVIIYSGILFGYYLVALRNKRFHYYNRFYLLMSVALSLLLPLLQLEIWQWENANPQVITIANIIVTNASEPESSSHLSSFTFTDFLLLAYAMIAACLLLSFISGLLKLIKMKTQYPSEKVGDVLFINTDLQQAPFSFFKNLFWKNSIDISDETGRQIFRHELTHIEQKHSSDKLFLQVTILLFWLNPFYWLIQKELSLIHEFIADEKAIDNKDAEAFAMMLLQSQFGKNTFLPLQSFYYSPIKRRLRMLTSSSNTSYSYARRLLALPVLSLCVLLFSFRLGNNHQSNKIFHVDAPFTLVVDAGHGGNDDGAIGGSGTTEKSINLSIAKKVAELAPQYGITVKMTRTEDATVSLPDRLDIIKKAQPDACVSIHIDVTEEKQTSQDAFSVYITHNNAGANYNQSRLLGSSLIQSVKTNLPVNDAIQQRTQGIYIIDQNPYPSVIIECGYMNNGKSLQQLSDNAGVEKIAKDILEGVVAYANSKGKTSMVVSDTSGKNPLYILDGKEISPDDIKKIDNNQIESINVLKEKEAIEKYGKKGENGVVLITMKNGAATGTGAITSNGYAKALQDVQNTKYKSALKIIDDKIVSNKDFSKLKSGDISVVVVLDAQAATKKFNEQGKNGAIIITTNAGNNYEIKPRNTEDFKGVYYLDGKEITKAEVNNVPADNIESINVWKGDEAVKKYGEKGRDGVIEITSKKISGSGSVTENNQPEEKYEKVFITVQEAPSFPGGAEAWISYLQRNLRADVPATNKAPAGNYTVLVTFQVDERGNISQLKAISDPGYGTAAEAIRVIQRGPKWIPAKQNGHTVTAIAKQVITFQVAG